MSIPFSIKKCFVALVVCLAKSRFYANSENGTCGGLASKEVLKNWPLVSIEASAEHRPNSIA